MVTSQRIGSWGSRLHLKLKYEKNNTIIITYPYQKKWPQVHDIGAYSMFVARTALGQPGAGHHFKLGWSWTKLFVIRRWYFWRTSKSHSNSLKRNIIWDIVWYLQNSWFIHYNITIKGRTIDCLEGSLK